LAAEKLQHLFEEHEPQSWRRFLTLSLDLNLLPSADRQLAATIGVINSHLPDPGALPNARLKEKISKITERYLRSGDARRFLLESAALSPPP
jgi:hypothetical protein